MTAIERVRRARVALLATVAGAALLWGALLAVGIILVVALADLAVPLPLGVRRLALPLAAVAAVVAVGVMLWRGRHARTLGRVALYLEERAPELQYTLATIVQPAGALAASGAAVLEAAVARAFPRNALRAPVVRTLAVPLTVLTLSLIAMLAIPHGTLERVLHPRPGDVLLRPAPRAPLGNRLTPIAVTVEPPRYARRAAVVTEDPSSVEALVGSRVYVRGRGAAGGATDSLGALLGADAKELPVTVAGDTWGVAIAMPGKPAVLRLVDRGYDRLLTLVPVVDEPPVVRLALPARDTTYSEPRGKLVLSAEVTDDIGLARAEFEVEHSSGGGESFETRKWIVARTRYTGARTAKIGATILLDTMKLGPGDVLHVRAIAWDENDVTGPGRGESDPRTIRIHDPRTQDTVSINPTKAAALDTSIISQRMLIIRAESLLAQRPRIKVEEYTSRSLDLGRRQGDLRRKVESIIYDLENVAGVGFVGETKTSKILREASVAMQDAQTELLIAQVPDALPHMRRALKLLMDARDAEKFYIRGVLNVPTVEVDRVRLQGRDRASVAGRDPRSVPADPRHALLTRLDRALRLLDTAPAAAADSITYIRVDALTQAADAAEPLGRAIDALSSGEDARLALVQALRRLERATRADSAPPAWMGGR
jgi:hypothetical protein